MKIGIDLDNTLINYEGVFYKAALEKCLIDPTTPKDKTSVKEAICTKDERLSTELQGYVYGSRLELALLYTGVLETLSYLAENGSEFIIISHKTRFPFLGPKYDLHKSAEEWIAKNLKLTFPHIKYIFCETIDEKVATINQQNCDFFIDDLPKVLNYQGFPANTERILFAPQKNQFKGLHCSSWQDILTLLKDRV